MTEERWTYGQAAERAQQLRPLVPAPWRVEPVGNSEVGYRLGIGNEEPGHAAYLSSDEDMKRLLDLYIEQLKAMRDGS